jgi:hypothetical protein
MAKKTKTSTDVTDVTNEMGDKMKSTFDSTNDIRVGLAALKAYGLGVTAAKAEAVYKIKKYGSNAKKIPFFEG